MKIVEVPEEVAEAFAPFREVMSRPQFQHFLHLVLDYAEKIHQE